jgi:formylglycine-generating enzyme required for sulfatase activity
MGRSEVRDANDYYPDGNGNEIPEHDATVSAFALDKYEVTVGRFRKFVSDYNTWRKAGNPVTDAGANPNVTEPTGWGHGWSTSTKDLPADSPALIAALKCDAINQTWTDEAGNNDLFPINCVNWYMAFAFCIWDGGRLPTEAEWEYAAAGGAQNRRYPWGPEAPWGKRANYSASGNSPFVSVGSNGASGAGFYGHQDLAGSMWEWVFDAYSESYYGTTSSPSICSNCANTATFATRIIRGGGWGDVTSVLRTANRIYGASGYEIFYGFRCARSP